MGQILQKKGHWGSRYVDIHRDLHSKKDNKIYLYNSLYIYVYLWIDYIQTIVEKVMDKLKVYA